MCEIPRMAPTPVDDGMIPPIVVVDHQDAILVIQALQHYADDYLTGASLIITDPTTCPVDALTVNTNSQIVVERVIRLINHIGADTPADSAKGN